MSQYSISISMNFFPKYLGPGDAWSVPVAAAVIFPLICFVLPLKSEKPLLNLKKVALVAASGPDVEATPADMTQGASAISGSSSSFEMVDMGMASLELCFKATEELLRSHCGNMVEVGSVAISAEWQGGVVLHASCSADLLARLVELEWAAALDLKPSINEIVEELWALQEAAPSEPDSEATLVLNGRESRTRDPLALASYHCTTGRPRAPGPKAYRRM